MFRCLYLSVEVFAHICCCSVAQSCPTLCDPWTAAGHASLSFTVSQSWLKLRSIKSVMPSNHLVLCHSILLPPSIFSSFMVFSNDSPIHIKRAKYWSFSISPSNEHPGLTSFGMDWFPLLAGWPAWRDSGLHRVAHSPSPPQGCDPCRGIYTYSESLSCTLETDTTLQT